MYYHIIATAWLGTVTIQLTRTAERGYHVRKWPLKDSMWGFNIGPVKLSVPTTPMEFPKDMGEIKFKVRPSIREPTCDKP